MQKYIKMFTFVLNEMKINDYRNPVIADAMKTFGYVNRFSRGINAVQEELVGKKTDWQYLILKTLQRLRLLREMQISNQ